MFLYFGKIFKYQGVLESLSFTKLPDQLDHNHPATMTSILSPVPRFIFTVLEPLSTFGGFLAPLLNPASSVADQPPSDEVVPLTPNSHVLALRLGNVYGLLAMLGVAVLYTTTEAKVVRNYLIAL